MCFGLVGVIINVAVSFGVVSLNRTSCYKSDILIDSTLLNHMRNNRILFDGLNGFRKVDS